MKPPPRSLYRVVLGDPFVMACLAPESPRSSPAERALRDHVKWSRSRAEAGVEDPAPLPPTAPTREEGEAMVSTGNLLKIPALTAEHSGNYSCHTTR